LSGKSIVFVFVLVLLLLGTHKAQAQSASGWSNSGWVSPGLRFGWRFGEGGGFFIGVEVSYMHWTTNGAVGAVVSIEALTKDGPWQRGFRLQTGVQYSAGIVGGAIGYSLLNRGSDYQHGYFGMLYGLAITLPYLAIDNYPAADRDPGFETGFMLKLPLKLSGPPVSASITG
jgi:hypothetical protein